MVVTLGTDERGSFGIGGRLATDIFLDAGPLTTPGFRPEGDLVREGLELGELDEVEEDFDALPSFIFALLIVNFRPPVDGLIVNSAFLSPSFLPSVRSPFNESLEVLSFFSIIVTASELPPTPARSFKLSTISDKLDPFRFLGGDAFALSTEKMGGLSSRVAGAVLGWEFARKDVANDDEDDDSPVDTLVIVRASLILLFSFSLTTAELEDETFGLDTEDELEDEEDDEDEEDEDIEDEEPEFAGREGLELELLSFSLFFVSFGESDGLENVGDADFNCVMLGLPKLVCFGDMLGWCFGLSVEGLGLFLPFGEEV